MDDLFQDGIFMWQFEREPEFDRKLRKWPKKYHRELQAMIDNLDTFAVALNEGVHVEQAKRQYRFLHGNYPHGIISIDQRGAGSNTKQSRLYSYPDEENKVLYQLTLGDKKSQKDDVAFCKKWVEHFLEKNKGEPSG